MAGADNILQRIRYNNIAERDEKRQEILSKQRNIPSLPNVKFTEEDVIKAAKILSNCNESKNIELAFSNLKIAFLQNPSYLVTFSKAEGALHALGKHLTSHNPINNLLAVECCCNISLGGSKTCIKLIKAIAPYLITILQGVRSDLCEIALQTIHNLCGSGKAACKLLCSHGVLKVFKDILSQDELREAALKALIMLTKNGISYMSKGDTILLAKLVLPYFHDYEKAKWLIYLLSSTPEIIPTLIDNLLDVSILLTLCSPIDSSNIISATSLVRLLGNMSSDKEGMMASFILCNWHFTTKAIDSIAHSQYGYLTKEMYWVIGNILQHPNPEIHEHHNFPACRDLSWLKTM